MDEPPFEAADAPSYPSASLPGTSKNR